MNKKDKESNKNRGVKGANLSMSTLKRLFSLSSSQTRPILIGSIALVLGSGINLLFPYLIKEILNENLGYSITTDLPTIALGLIALFALQASFFYVRHYYFYLAGHRVVGELRTKLFSSIVSKDINFFDTARVGDLLSRLSSDTQLVQRAVTINISVFARYSIQVIGGLLLMLFISWKLTLVIILLIPFLVVISMTWGKKLKSLSKKMQEALSEASVRAEEAITSIRTVIVYSGSNYETGLYKKAINQSVALGTERSNSAAAFSSCMVFLIHSSLVGVVCFGASLVLKNELSLGDLSAFVMYGIIVAVSLSFIAGTWEEVTQSLGACERIFEIIDRTSLVHSPLQPVSIPTHQAPAIVFDRVFFRYASRPEKLILEDLSFEIPSGKTLALVGPSGAGKSTIASLIPRFYDPEHGKITYNSLDIKEVSLDDLRSHISVVAQSPQVFSSSIGENIRYGNLSATDEEVIQAAKAAYLHDFIMSLSDGYQTLVGDKGIQLSGGEKQRVAIARALIKNPKLIILDEATSSLDSENEHLIQKALMKLLQNRTALIIAHRLSTVQHADIVLVLEEGKILQSGTHQSLVNSPGLYQNLVQYQLLS